ncbi:MAG: T9SS C-terminal target domain-containing protein [Bacteroidetes bacterium]|nr:MAG: T9SS C-terminal target domain-containing protein [Bacteroidota bacterium]
MKKASILFLVAGIIIIAGYGLLPRRSNQGKTSTDQSFSNEELTRMPTALQLPFLTDLQVMKLRNPQTGKIPVGIRSRELAFAAGLPVNESSRSQHWNWRGPNNIGGRMLCIAIDLEDEDHLLAGSASGGMWQSLDGGNNWSKVTSPDAEQSATCIRQDTRPGHRDTWYYGTGEMLSTTNRNISTNVRTLGIGNGIFKSTDNGNTWEPLPSTQDGSPGDLNEIFQGIWRIVTDPVTMDKDIVYAACYGAIMRSEDGGETWQMVLGDIENKSFGTDLAITTDGTLYAILGSYGWGIEPPGKAGVWRSTDGLDWKNITPAGFPDDNRANRLVIPPSNELVLYVLTESQSPDLNPFNGYANSLNTFWKMTWDPAGDSAIWENRTAGTLGGGSGSINDFPFSFVSYGGYCFTLGVHPEDENIVIIGGMNLYRSENGFADSLNTVFMGGYPYDMDSLHALHPDMHGMAFLPSDPDVLFISCDGGVYITYNCLADSADMYWNRQNNKLTTTQFYSVTIDHGGSGDDWILGGLQDNNWYYTVTNDLSAFWFNIDICYDGFATCVATDWEYCAISAYSGNIWTSRFDTGMYTMDIFPQLPDTLLKYYDPVMGSNALFPFYQNFALDPNNYETFYLPTITSIWRKANLKTAAYDSSLRNAGWEHLSNVDIGDASEISYITVSKNPANRLYYGTNLGRVYRLDNAHTGNPVPLDITAASFPKNAFVACIDVDESNADRIVVVFSNYEIQSIFSSEDGGTTWIAQGGNLEENPDGSGSGPSVRWVKSLTYDSHLVWFAGTSVGLYSTSELKGDSTTWKQEGAESIGSVIIDMIDARQTDGFIAVGTHGNGVYSTWYDPAAAIGDPFYTTSLQISKLYPNPARDNVTADVLSDSDQFLEITLYTLTGGLKGIPYQGRITSGKNIFTLDIANVPSGTYFMHFRTATAQAVKKLVVIR